MLLDRDRPYGHVAGLPGVAFTQDGHHFDGSGRPVAYPEGEAAPPSQESPPPPQPDKGGATPVIASSVPLPKSDDMRLSANKALKLQMENFGEPWQGVEHAREFLGVKE